MHFFILAFAFLFGRLSPPPSCLCLASFLISIAAFYNPTPSPSPLSFQLFCISSMFLPCYQQTSLFLSFDLPVISFALSPAHQYLFCPVPTRNKHSNRSSVQNRNCIVHVSPALTFFFTLPVFTLSPFFLSPNFLQRATCECKRPTSLRYTWRTVVSGSTAPFPPRPAKTPSTLCCGMWGVQLGQRPMSSCWESNALGPLSTGPTQMKKDCDEECRLRGCRPVFMCWRWTGQNPAILGHTTAWWKNGWVTQMELGIDSPGILQGSHRFWSDSQVSKSCLSQKGYLFPLQGSSTWLIDPVPPLNLHSPCFPRVLLWLYTSPGQSSGGKKNRLKSSQLSYVLPEGRAQHQQRKKSSCPVPKNVQALTWTPEVHFTS